MSSISERINNVINVRKSKLPLIEKKIEDIDNCYNVIKRLENLQDKLKVSVDKGNSELVNKLAEINTDSFNAAYGRYRTMLVRLKKRFERNELHISFVGKARQGKSLVLQSISGLDGKVIPSADGMDCTGAKSIITNYDTDVPYAKITFFSEQEMAEIVNTYLESIFPGGGYHVSSVNEIKSLPIDDMESSLSYDQSTAKSRIAHLRKYVENIGDFEKYLGQEIRVGENDIEKYVSQYNSVNQDIKYYNYLGVKKANILCRFPHEDIGKIVLMDTIGMGATSLGVEESMMETVREDSDAVVIMFRPDSMGDSVRDDIVRIIQKISEEISSEYTKELMFMVLNRVVSGKGENINLIPELHNRLNRENYPIAKVLEVNCIDKQDVSDNLITPILEQMTSCIDKVDQFLISRIEKAADLLYAEFGSIRSKLEKTIGRSVSNDIRREFFDDIKRTVKTGIINTIRDLYLKKYNPMRNMPCEPFKQDADKRIRNIYKTIPTKEHIVQMLSDGTLNQHNVYEKCTDEARIQIINDFFRIDTTLTDIVNDVKIEILNIFTSDEYGRLGRILPFDNQNPNEWIENFIDKVDGEEQFPLLTQALRFFGEFTISVQGFLIYEVRDKLDPIDNSLRTDTPQIGSGLSDKNGVAKDIIAWLTRYLTDLQGSIRKRLFDLYKIPNMAIFAAIKDLYDRIAYSKTDDGKANIDTEWRYLYENWIPSLWPEKCGKLQSKVKVNEGISDILSDLKKYDRKEIFFINMR